MSRHLASALAGIVITAISMVGIFAQMGNPSPGRRLAHLASLPAIPGQLAALLLGLGRGPEGFPTQDDIAPYVFTFLIWWAAIDLGLAWLGKRRPRT